MKITKFGFIGLGLIGGSIAKAIRKKYEQTAEISAFDSDNTVLECAKKEGILDFIYSELTPQLGACDYLFLCTPVHSNRILLEKMSSLLSPSCILTDVGSVKKEIQEEITALSLDEQFIGGHPMAGSEKSGYTSANALLLENAYYVLIPGTKLPPSKLEAFTSLIASLGSIPLVMDARMHDYITAGISHLPHIIASALVNLIQSSDSAEEYMKTIAAGGFKDITRIASSSPNMWQQICLSNKDAIASLLNDYIISLQQVETALRSNDSQRLFSMFENAKEYRDTFATHSGGPLPKIFGCYVDIPDKAGVISTIAALLAKHSINLKNIGIVHNREFEEGVLQLEFYDAPSLHSTEELCLAEGYTLYKRH